MVKARSTPLSPAAPAADQAGAAVRLTARQRVFVAEYLKSWNAADAARKAGYSVKTAREMGAENLTKPHIKAAIVERLNALAMEADEALYRLSEIARGSMAEFVDADTGAVDLARAEAAGRLGLVKRVTHTVSDSRTTTTIELYDAQDALKTILNERRLIAGKPTSRMDVTSDGKPLKGYIGISPDDWDTPDA